MRLLLPALLLAASAAGAQAPLSDGPDAADPMSCARFEAASDGGRIAMLMAIEPFGDDIGSGDEQAAKDWSREVAKHCAGHPERPLTEAVNEANASIEAE